MLDWEDIAVESGSPAKGDTTSQRDDDTSATAHGKLGVLKYRQTQ